MEQKQRKKMNFIIKSHKFVHDVIVVEEEQNESKMAMEIPARKL